MSSGAAIVDLAEYRARKAREARGHAAPVAAPYVAMAPVPLVWPYVVCSWAPCIVWLQPWHVM
jgi:hypothetical protein